MTTFTVTDDHLKLLKESFVDYDDSCETGGFAQDPKRPYGDSDVAGNVYEVLHGEMFDQDDEMPDDLYESLMQLHREVATALQIIVFTQKFETGTYETVRKYDTRSWKKVDEK